MRALQELHKLRCHGIVYAIGGSKKQTTTNEATNYDQRSVLTDSQNTYDLSNNSTTTSSTANAWTDASVSNSNNTTNADFSDRSMTVDASVSSYDLSNRSVTNTSNTTNADFSNRSVTNTSSSTSSAWADSSNSNNTTNADFSNRSVTNTSSSTSSAWADSSTNNSNNTTNADFSDRSTSYTTTNTTDGGAIAGALGLAKDAAGGALDQLKTALGFASSVASGQQASTVHAYDYADGIFTGALDFVNKNDARALEAFDRAAAISENSFGQLQNAYADAKGTTQAQQKMVFAVLAVAGAAIIASRMRA